MIKLFRQELQEDLSERDSLRLFRHVEAPPPAPWEAPALEPGEDTEPDALTVIGTPVEDVVADPWESVVEDGAEPEPELAERGGLFRRRRR